MLYIYIKFDWSDQWLIPDQIWLWQTPNGQYFMRFQLVMAVRVNLWYFFVVRNIWKDDSNDEEEEEEESSDITDSEQEEKKVRSRRLPARR